MITSDNQASYNSGYSAGLRDDNADTQVNSMIVSVADGRRIYEGMFANATGVANATVEDYRAWAYNATVMLQV